MSETVIEKAKAPKAPKVEAKAPAAKAPAKPAPKAKAKAKKKVVSKADKARSAVKVLVEVGVIASYDAKAINNRIRKNLI